MARKQFGATPRNAPPPQREHFDFTVQRDGVDETLAFTAVIRFDVVGMLQMMHQSKVAPEMAGLGMLTMISKLLDNTDGVPDKWIAEVHNPEPASPPRGQEPVPPHRYSLLEDDAAGPGAWPVEAGQLDEEVEEVEERPAVFRAPYGPEKGELLPFERAEEFERFEAGSSRRRWRQRLLEDDEVTVHLDAIKGLFEWLVGLAAARPTR